MSSIASLASSSAAFVPAASQAGTNSSGAVSVSSNDAPITTSPEVQISPQAKALAEFYEAASAFVREEHIEPFTGWKRDSAGYTLNYESAYLDVEKYNNYLFDKAATTLVEQAKQLGLALDKDETLAQLKADNADIAAISFNNTERVKYLKMCQSVGFSNLSYGEVESLTDMYILAKENGLDATQVGTVAFYLGGFHHNDDNAIMGELYELPYNPDRRTITAEEIAAYEAGRFAHMQDSIDLAGEIKAKLPNVTFGFNNESGFFASILNPRLTLAGEDTLSFLLQIADFYSSGPASDETWSWSPSTGWTTDPDSPEAAASRAAYEKWLEKTAAELQQLHGDKSGTGAHASGGAGQTEDLEAALANIAHEKELLAQLLEPSNRLAHAEDDSQESSTRPDKEAPVPTLDSLKPAWPEPDGRNQITRVFETKE
jgi:hypothetical protein